MKYLKSILLGLGIFFVLNLIVTIFSYFNILSDKGIMILKIITFIIPFISSGIYIGLNSKKKAYIEGLKVSLIFILLSITFTLLIKGLDFSLKIILYYVFTILLCIIGSSIGINLKKAKK